MAEHFERSKLSPKGFFVHVDDRDITLPDGSAVENGLIFRNTFHLNDLSSADLFVPCGGRPEAVHINNVKKLFDIRGNPRFKWIVEGANLFFTQTARLELEKSGVVIIKDASANKGGVTSSSFEVLAALALTDELYQQHMQVLKGQIPAFYERYIHDVQDLIAKYANAEFDCLWREHEKTGTMFSKLSDDVSVKINDLNDALQKSALWNNTIVRTKVLLEAFPKSLVELIGLDEIMKHVPQSYLKAVFGARLASSFVYKYGINPPEFAFMDFIESYIRVEEA
eukprot:TRINITY_DN27173_c0_g1_i1.p1 TRINITY_DN27173_c0_g1~~TRINITY_DN27173_c0_g1_i1.p1  ORF type:complete len:313 (-),score=11.50 TRINITY_DN27173_c0_g1_i1:74-919(-)